MAQLGSALGSGEGVAGSNPVNPTDKAPGGFSFRSFLYALNLIRAIYPIREYRLFGATDAVVRSLAVEVPLRLFHLLMEP